MKLCLHLLSNLSNILKLHSNRYVFQSAQFLLPRLFLFTFFSAYSVAKKTRHFSETRKEIFRSIHCFCSDQKNPKNSKEKEKPARSKIPSLTTNFSSRFLDVIKSFGWPQVNKQVACRGCQKCFYRCPAGKALRSHMPCHPWGLRPYVTSIQSANDHSSFGPFWNIKKVVFQHVLLIFQGLNTSVRRASRRELVVQVEEREKMQWCPLSTIRSKHIICVYDYYCMHIADIPLQCWVWLGPAVGDRFTPHRETPLETRTQRGFSFTTKKQRRTTTTFRMNINNALQI